MLGSKDSLRLWTERFLQYVRVERRYSQLTIKAYAEDLSRFTNYVCSEYDVKEWSELTRVYLRSYVVSLVESGLSSVSVHRKISSVRSFLRYLIKEGQLKTNPASGIPLPKCGKRLVSFVEETGMQKLENGGLDLVESLYGKSLSAFETYRNYMILQMFYGTGMRLAELLSLKDADVNSTEGVVKVLGKRNKERLIPVPEVLCREIDEYRKLRDNEFMNGEVSLELNSPDVFFVDKKAVGIVVMSRSYVYRLVKKCLRSFTSIEKCSPHVLRHTYATHILNEGADLNAVKMLLGHSSLASTQVYTHNTIEKLKKAYSSAHPKA